MKCIICNQEINQKKDLNNPFSEYYDCFECGKYYLEPVFKRKLEMYMELHGKNENYYRILGKMKELSVKNLVVFTDDIDNNITLKVKDAIFIEFRDILDFLNIHINDISRGSDYGD